jgi:hypothetical protein
MACSNVKECACANVDCANHAKCCACVSNHREKGNLPVCLRPKTDKK